MNSGTYRKSIKNVVIKAMFLVGMGCFTLHSYGALCELKNGKKGTVIIVDTVTVYDSLSKSIQVKFKNGEANFIPKKKIKMLIITNDTLHFNVHSAPAQNSIDTSTIQFCFKYMYIFDINGSGSSIAVEVSHKNILFAISYKAVSDFKVLSPAEPTSEIALLFGKKVNLKNGYASVSTGISLIETTRIDRWVPNPNNSSFFNLFDGEYEMKHRSDFGIPLKAAAVLKLLYVGLGIELSANINAYAPMLGAGAILYLGTYRSLAQKN